MMAEDAQPAPMKPQETTNYLLGQISGQVGALQNAVNQSAASQASINAANEVEHAELRRGIAAHDIAIAVIQDGKISQQQTKITRLQQWSLWLGVPAAIATICGLLVFINLHP
jgi:hypothetical protein